MASNLLESGGRNVSDRVISYGLYIDPPLGRTGLSETKARRVDQRAAEADMRLKRLYDAIESGSLDPAEIALGERIAGLTALRAGPGAG